MRVKRGRKALVYHLADGTLDLAPPAHINRTISWVGPDPSFQEASVSIRDRTGPAEGRFIELTLIVVHLVGMVAVESIVKLHNIRVRGISAEGVSSAVKAENESVGNSLGRLYFLTARMYFMCVPGRIGGSVAIDPVGLRARVSHGGIRAAKRR